MSANALPITPARFANALEDLPVSALYAKYAELQNSIKHMEASNKELENFARDNDDRDCYEALLENRDVIKRFLERIDMLKNEVTEVRGLPWRPQGDEDANGNVEPGLVATNAVPAQNGTVQSSTNATGVNGTATQQSERSGQEAAQNGTEEEGVFL